MSVMNEIAETLQKGEYRPNGCYLVRSIKTGKILITQSPEEAKINEWAIPQGGFDDDDSSAEQNAYRELGEEANIGPHEIESIDPEFAHPFIQDFSAERIAKEQAKGRNFRGKKYFPMLVKYEGSELLNTSSEIRNYKWVDLKTAKALLSQNSGKGANLYGMLCQLG